MGLQPLDALLHGSLALGPSGGRRQNYHIVELLQILIRRIEDQLVLGVLRDGGPEIVRHQTVVNNDEYPPTLSQICIRFENFEK